MNELFIYSLFKNIFNASIVIEGRFFVFKRSGMELNSNNLNEIVTDEMNGLKELRKYPLVALFPPVEIVQSYFKGWSTFRLIMFFLTPDGRNGDGTIKAHNMRLNISDHTPEQDWKDMREVAGNFRMKMNEVVRDNNLLGHFREKSQSDVYTRLANVGNDRLNGVMLQFEVELSTRCNPIADYSPEAIITIPEFNLHPLHQH